MPNIRNEKYRDSVITSLYNALHELLAAKHFNEAKEMLEAYYSIIPTVGHSQAKGTGKETGTIFSIREGFASKAILLSVVTQDDRMFLIAEQFMPEEISDKVLAFNLACLYALKKDKENLIHYTRMAIRLGKNKVDFMKDTDFEAFMNDAEFLDTLEP